jgi:hypothetical protein
LLLLLRRSEYYLYPGAERSVPQINYGQQPKEPGADDKAGQRVDFISQKTGNWSFYYH